MFGLKFAATHTFSNLLFKCDGAQQINGNLLRHSIFKVICFLTLRELRSENGCVQVFRRLFEKSSPRKCFRIILRADAFLFILPMGGLRNCRPCNGQLNSKPRESRLAFRIHWISAARSSYTRHLDDTACQANRGCGPDPVPILPLPKYPQIPWCIMHQG